MAKIGRFEVVFRIFSGNPPAGAIVLGVLFLLMGYLWGIEVLIEGGWSLFVVGVLVEVLWLYLIGRSG